MYKDERDLYETLGSDCETLRSPYEPLWEDIDAHIAPRMVRLQLTETDKADRDDSLIVNSTATTALEICGNGFLAHGSSPGKPWIKLKPEDPEMADYGPVAEFCDQTAAIMLETLEDSGTYEVLHSLYEYMIGFSNGLIFVEESFDDVIQARALPLGSWWVGKDARGRVNLLRRKLRMTVRSVVETFAGDPRKPDWSRISRHVKNLWDKGDYLKHVDICHIVLPNDDYDPRYQTADRKMWKSVYYEMGGRDGDNYSLSTQERNTYLRKSGYDLFPALLAQWHVMGDDVYGMRCPGLTALPDAKELYHWELKSATALDKMVDPPTFGGPWTKNLKIGHFPGQHTAVNDPDLQRGGIRKLYEQDPRTLEVEARVERIQKRVEKVFHVDTFRMLDYFTERTMTATEVMARQQEQLGQLTGVMNRLVRSVYNPLVERLFSWLAKQGRLPAIPEELEGAKLNVEYVSTMAQAMKSHDTNSIQRVFDAAFMLSKGDPASPVWDVVNVDEGLPLLGQSVQAPAKMFNGPEEIAAIRDQRAQAQAAQAKAEQMQALTQSAKNLGSIPTDQPNALTDIVNAVGGGA